MEQKFYEDLEIGESHRTKSRTVNEDEIISFAKIYDNQPFHVNAEAASRTIYGGLISSGYLTLCLAWSLFLELGFLHSSSMGGPGLNYVRWPRPVRPGDTISVESKVVRKRDSSKPGRGIVTLSHVARNQNGEVVLESESVHLIAKRGNQKV